MTEVRNDETQQSGPTPEEARSYLCADCELIGRQTRAVTVVGDKPLCGPCARRECAY